MRPIEILKELNLLSWQTLLIGWDSGWGTRQDVIDYAVKWLTEHPNELDNRVVLIAGGESYTDNDLRGLLTEYLTYTKNLNTTNEKNSDPDKWRLAHLLKIAKEDVSAEVKLDQLEEVYATFGYPEDMAACSRYYISEKERTQGWAVGDQSAGPLDTMYMVIEKLKRHFNVV